MRPKSSPNFIVICKECGDELLGFTVIVREDADGTCVYETEVQPHKCNPMLGGYDDGV